MRNYKMLRDLHSQFPEVVILAFPTRDFLSQEFKEPAKVKAFAAKHGPSGMVVLMTKPLASRPGWWSESQPSWNFKGKWLVSPSGERTLVDDPFSAVGAAVGALAGADRDGLHLCIRAIKIKSLQSRFGESGDGRRKGGM